MRFVAGALRTHERKDRRQPLESTRGRRGFFDNHRCGVIPGGPGHDPRFSGRRSAGSRRTTFALAGGPRPPKGSGGRQVLVGFVKPVLWFGRVPGMCRG
jgi:hypothetical protein